MKEINHEFAAFIKSESVPEVVKKKLEEEWVRHTTKNNVKNDAAWQRNIKGKEEAFQRFQKNSQTGPHNTKERVGSNRYNNSHTNREYDRHPRYQPRNPKNPYNPYMQEIFYGQGYQDKLLVSNI